MCGIFGIVYGEPRLADNIFESIGNLSERRGKDSSGILYSSGTNYKAIRADMRFSKLIEQVSIGSTKVIMGHSRLITNGQSDNQPVIRDGLALIHNGIITNDIDFWKDSKLKRLFEIDSEVILGVAIRLISQGGQIEGLYNDVKAICKGSFSCGLLIPNLGKLVIFSNTGSLHIGKIDGNVCFASERTFLESVGCTDIYQLTGQEIFDVPLSNENIIITDYSVTRPVLIPKFSSLLQEEKKLIFPEPNLTRCTKCILPETMPFISFDCNGVCNYCSNYKLRNTPKPLSVLENMLKSYRAFDGVRSIMPFSGGRDSSFALHLIAKEFGIRPVTMTYDWGMVTDLARRNISRMCGELNVENILIADDIANKRRNIKLNLQAWLKKPNLGMINILMAGDKHFFRYIENIKRETNISLNIWGMNPLEVTHFKAGFLGFQPDFGAKQVFYTGLFGQIRYQSLRVKAMIDNPSYINFSLWDTLSGEYFRSVKKKTDFYNIFDYWQWDEEEIDQAIASYGWEKATDTKSTWRIGDGTAAFYNYVYYTMAGFTEYDTFRSNQIREGQMTRARALELVAEENQPRFLNIKWYLDAIEMDFDQVINVINNAPRLYER